MSHIRIVTLCLGCALAAPAASEQLGKDPAGSFYTGVWSFDGTCASGDGMALAADGNARFDEWGEGLWAESADGGRLFLILKVMEPGLENPKPRIVFKEFRATFKRMHRLEGEFLDDKRTIEAVKCPAEPAG